MLPNFLYKAMFFVGLALSIVANLLITSKERKLIKDDAAYAARLKTIKPVHTVLNAVIILVFGVIGAMLMAMLYNKVFNATTDVCIFGSIILPPIAMFIYYHIMRFDWKYAMDLLAIEVYIILGFSKIGCTIVGCCGGKIASFGFQHDYLGNAYFPVQIFESVSTFIIAAICIYYVVKRKQSGLLYPLSTMLYCAVRFGWEFMRYYKDGSPEGSFFIGLTFWQCMALGVFVCCGIWALIQHSVSKKKNAS